MIQADARSIPLPSESVQVVVTSPPYWGLRSYGLSDSIWGPPTDCPHQWDKVGLCTHCEAWCGQLGLEPNLDLYIEHLLEIFAEVWRVLRPDGTLWLNLGDSYSSANSAGIKPKDLCMIPARVALALQAQGWYLRSDIIWEKENSQPESVRDRPTRSYEHVFLLTKSPRYYYNADAIREPLVERTLRHPRFGTASGTGRPRYDRNGQAACPSGFTGANPAGRNKRDVWTINTSPYRGAHFATMPEKLVEPCILAGSRAGDLVLDPFCGSGTVPAVARRLGRSWVGIDLKAAYLELARKRIYPYQLGEMRA